jgi:hypothetical protein
MRVSNISGVKIMSVVFDKQDYPDLFEVAYRNRFNEALELFGERSGERVITTMDIEVRGEYVSFKAIVE